MKVSGIAGCPATQGGTLDSLPRVSFSETIRGKVAFLINLVKYFHLTRQNRLPSYTHSARLGVWTFAAAGASVYLSLELPAVAGFCSYSRIGPLSNSKKSVSQLLNFTISL